MSRRRLHSRQTILLKTLFPCGWIPGFAAATLILFLGSAGFTGSSGQAPPPGMKWFFLGGTIIGSVFIYWTIIRMKLVWMDSRSLYVSNLFTKIVIPLENVEVVAERRRFHPHLVTIEFSHDTEFGKRIAFMPEWRVYGFGREHPVVVEIRAAAAVRRGHA